MRRRQGFTLTELLVAAAAGSSLMMTAILLVHQSMRLTTAGGQKLESSMQLDRAARQFRTDVHLAESADPVNVTELTLTLGDGSEVIYRMHDHRLSRTYLQDGSSRSTNSFALAERMEVVFSKQQDPTRVTMQVHSRPRTQTDEPPTESADDALRLHRHVTAVLGRLVQMEQATEVSP